MPEIVKPDAQPCTLHYSTKIIYQGARGYRLPIVVGEDELADNDFEKGASFLGHSLIELELRKLSGYSLINYLFFDLGGRQLQRWLQASGGMQLLLTMPQFLYP